MITKLEAARRFTRPLACGVLVLGAALAPAGIVAAPAAPDSPSTLDQLEQAAKIRKLDAETGRIQTEAVRNIADAQRPPQVIDYAGMQ